MSYIGRGLDKISNVETLDNITFDGSTTYALTKSSAAFTPVGKNNILISIDGVIQQGNFTVSTTNIVFDWSPTSSNTCNWIMHYGVGVLNVPADDAVSTAKIQDGAITAAKIADGTVVAAEIASNAVTTAKINADAVTGAKIADDAIDSEHYTDGSIDTAHIADLNVTTAKLAADSVTAAKIGDDVIDSEHYADGSIDNAHIADDQIDSEHYVDGSIDTAHIGNLQVTTAKIAAAAIDGTKLADDAVDSEHYTDASIDNAHLADDAVGVAELSATGTASSSTFLRGDNSWASAGGANTPAFYAYISSSTTAHTTGTLTKVAFNTEVFDVGSCFDTSNNRFVVPAGEGGKYYFWGNIRWADGLTAKELSFVPYLNGSGFGWVQLHTPDYSAGWHTIFAHFTRDLNATDYVELYARHNKGSNHNIGGGNELNCNFGGFKIIE